MKLHPDLDDRGRAVTIHSPHVPTPLGAWADPTAVAIVVPAGPMPYRLNHVLFRPWKKAPADALGWETRFGGEEVEEDPPFEPMGLQAAAGAVVVEPDGRVWLVAPTNGYHGYRATFPKGQVDAGFTLQACARKETFEETGLWVELVAHLIDLPRARGFARYYLARRRGGTPSAMGWESQAVHLVPLARLEAFLNRDRDLAIARALGAVLRPR